MRPLPTPLARRLRELFPTLVTLAVLLFARSSLADHYYVPSGSMLPTVEAGDHVVVNKLAYGLRLPFSSRFLTPRREAARGDVVVLDSPRDGTTLLKRVVARPGDRVEVREGALRLNGSEVRVEGRSGALLEALDGKPHPLRLDAGGGPDFGPVTVPEGHYLVLGDNRGDSLDGRYFGFVRAEALRGRAFAICVRGGRPTWEAL
ncbi:MAG TPA: signal peptidase I [Polyangiaceae bacterium]|nr:signal peptidase I [Polyangiaceae bacterium]